MSEDTRIISRIENTAQRGLEHQAKSRNGLELPTSERAEQLWGLFNEYSSYRKSLIGEFRSHQKETKKEDHTNLFKSPERDVLKDKINHDSLVQRLEGEISHLWQDPAVRAITLAKIKESIAERKPHSVDLKGYQKLKEKHDGLEEAYFDLLRNEFLMRRMTPTLRRIDIARNRMETDAVKKVIALFEQPQPDSDGRITKDQSELSGLFANERLKDYHREWQQNGFIMTASREALLDEVLEKTAAGTWMQLVGETGSGKTTFAKRTSQILNGESPQYASGERWGDVRALIGTKTMDATGKVYFDFGPLTIALTGHTSSLELEEALKSGHQNPGKLLLLDELNKFDQDALFGALKIVSTLRPGETFNFKELPGVTLKMAEKGFALISTMNPATVRYERKELDPALERLFYGGKRTVDYLPMTTAQPELYEAFLGILMDDNGRIRVSPDELGPSFVSVKDDTSGLVKSEIDQDNAKHGTLYRFSLAAAEIHKSFTQKTNIATSPANQGFLEKTVLDMQVLTDWVSGYMSQIEGGESLSTYLERNLHDFYENIESVNDKAIFRTIFTRFNFDIETPKVTPKPAYEPLTPLEIGFLTPRTQREIRRIGEEAIPRTKLYINPDSGEEIEYLPISLELEGDEVLTSGTIIESSGKKYRYLGIDANSNESIFEPVKEDLNG
jgi:energy-coupling factor transporter ATP-binding protein EcfA2